MQVDGLTRAAPGRRAAALLLAAHPGPTVAVTGIAATLAVAIGSDPSRTVLLVSAVLTGQLSVGWSNDLLDQARDRRTGRTDKPLASGSLDPRTVRTACALAVVATTGLSLSLGVTAGLTHLLGVGCGWAYNLGLKSTLLSPLPYAVAFAALAAVPPLAAGDPVPWWLPTVGALLGVGAHLVNVLPDLDDDAATGVAGLPHRVAARWGRTGLTTGAAGPFVIATGLLLAVLPRGPWVWATAVVVAGLVLLVLLGRGRTPFLAAILIAVADVVALAVAL